MVSRGVPATFSHEHLAPVLLEGLSMRSPHAATPRDPVDALHERLSTTMHATSRSPEQRLMAAVLDDACSVHCHPERARSRDERDLLSKTQDWIASDEPPSRVFTFRHVCAVLDLDPSVVRETLDLNLRHRRLAA